MEVIDGLKLKSLRKRQGLTMRGLARACEARGVPVPHTAVRAYEAGERQPRYPKLLVLAEVFGIEPDDLTKEAA